MTPQPIETYRKPSDVKRILLYWPNRGWITGTYIDFMGEEAPNTPREGYIADGDRCIAKNSAPTYWMPLPAAPGSGHDADAACISMLHQCREAIASLEEGDLGWGEPGDGSHYPIRDQFLANIDATLANCSAPAPAASNNSDGEHNG